MIFDIESKKQGTQHWVKYIKSRIRKNKNFLGVFIGQTGSGKSYSAVSLADMLHDMHLPKENICFKAKDFINRLDNGLKDGTLHKGDVLIWDEAGIDLNAKKWQSLINRIVSSVMQVFRQENIIVLFTVPYFNFIDSDARKLIHAFFQTEKIDSRTGFCVVKPFNIQINQITGKMYRKSLRIRAEHGEIIKVKRIVFELPRPEVRNYYESVANSFKRDVISQAKQDIEMIEQAKLAKRRNGIDPLTVRQRQAVTMAQQGLNGLQIAEKLKVVPATVYGLLASAKLKGINPKIREIPIENVDFESNATIPVAT